MADYSILDYNKYLANPSGYAAPIGPSLPGYVQGTADRVQENGSQGTVNNVYTPPANTGPSDSQLTQLQKIKDTGGGLNPSQTDLYNQLTKNAQAGNQSTLDAIQKRLDETRTQAKQQIDNATGTRDYVLNFINSRYPELTNRVEQQRGNALQDLGTQQTDLQTLYDRANAQSRRRSEDAALQNRMIARAGNRLGSSFYDQTVAQNQENLGKTLGASDLERIGKMAAINTQKDRTNQDYNNTVNDLETQKNQATYSAFDEYKKAVQQAEALSRAGVLDFGEGQAQATQNLQSRLDSIAQWAQGMAQQKQALDTQYGTGGGFDTSLANLANTNQSFMQNNAQTPAGNNLSTYNPTVLAGPQQQASTPNLYANQGIRSTEDILKQLGLA